ncbi:unnamed protein product, partial [Effrenium voratum]
EAPSFTPPAPGHVLLKISTAAPLGRILCPEDLHDWAVLSVSIDGMYRLPQKLLEAGGPLPEPGTAEGPLETHPFRYSARVLGSDFNLGQLVLPHVDVPEPTEEEGSPPEPDSPTSPEPDISFDIGTEEFTESLMRAGFPAAKVDGPAAFNFLCRPRTGLGGRIGLQDFLRLLEISVPASTERLLELYDKLVEKHESIETAFNALDANLEGALTQEAFSAGLEELGLEDVEPLFVALDSSRQGYITREDFRILSMTKRMKDLELASTAVRWLVTAAGSLPALLEQVDEQKQGSVTLQDFLSAATRLGFPEASAPGLEVAFGFAQLAEPEAESLSHKAFLSLKALEADVPSALVKLEELLFHDSADPALQTLSRAESVSFLEFQTGLQGAPLEPQALFFVLDSGAGSLGAPAFASVQAVNAAAQLRRLANCRRFVENGFGAIDANAFRALFEQGDEFEAEETLPRVSWPKAEVRSYRGRQWLQRLLNTLQDDRGRNLMERNPGSQSGGAWLYLFPVLEGQSTASDFKELPDAQVGMAKLARWHHARAFLDLRRLVAPGAEVEFRAYLTQVEAQPQGDFEADWTTPYRACETYIKGIIRLDRPLQRLCPRDVRLPMQPSGEPYIPPPPAKRPPPTVNEELEKEAAKIIGRLSFDFARWCHDSGFTEDKDVGPPALGKKGVKRHAFLQWLQESDVLKDLGDLLRPAVVRLVRAEKSGPACGLSGNENDAKYSYLRDYISKHLFRALNSEVEQHRQLRDERLWRLNAQDAEETWQAQDATLKRLTIEYELLGNWRRAREVYEEWLFLEPNVENGQAWFGFARFLMRCEQSQLDAERVLRYAISLRTEEAGPDFQEVAFLAGILINHRLPSSMDEGPRSARFEAALAMMESYADRHALERLPLYMIFLIFAVEARVLRQAAENPSEAQAKEAGQLAEQGDRLAAEAAKYLELARAAPESWLGTLDAGGEPVFPELEALVTQEKVNRGQALEAPKESPAMPAAWLPTAAPPFPDPASLHAAPEAEDAAALEAVDFLLHFGLADLASFLLTHAVEAYGFLSPATAMSERCRLQLVKAAMLSKDWEQAESLLSDLFSRRGGDRLPEAHSLLGECRFQAACAGAGASYSSALAAFETALAFMEDTGASPKEDPVLHLRVGRILHLQAEDGDFKDAAIAERAVKHYKKSVMVSPTAEAWKNIGLCRYRLVKHAQSNKEQKLQEAMKYLQEANLLDRERPEILAWLGICAVELGLVQIAKQAFRQLMRFEERLEVPVALELANVFLRFSNEQQASYAERGRLVQDGRYCAEAAAMAKAVMDRGQCGRAQQILAWCKALQGDHGAAAGDFCAALPNLQDPAALEEAANMARHCASMVPGEPHLVALVEEAIAMAVEPKEPEPTESCDGLDNVSDDQGQDAGAS